MTEPLTIRALIAAYKTDDVSTYHDIRHKTQQNYDSLLRRIENDHGDVALPDIKFKTLRKWHMDWVGPDNHIASAHSLIGMVRTLVGFGFAVLEDVECQRLALVLHKMRFPMAKPRESILTAQQVKAICHTARCRNLPEIALAQAIQFECTLRQKDVIGEYVPYTSREESDLISARYGKWLRGVRWEEIDKHLVLRHVTSKRGKPIEVDLHNAPMVMVELQSAYCELGVELTREMLPKSGPIIIWHKTTWPFTSHQFRRLWREIATTCGVPKDVYSMDTRAGAITEAMSAGAAIDDVRHAATHSDIGMTQKYSRDGAKRTASVMQTRAQSRNPKAS